jgi:menaquinone-9 beta-reductase
VETCEVLIVGGGPAGSSCAWRLLQSGADVLVLDKKQFPRDKPCAGWVTPQVIETLRIELDDYRRNGRVLQPIRSFRTGLIGGRERFTEFSEPVSYGIRRCEFDTYLLDRCGARLRLGETLRSIEPTDGGWLVNGRIEARIVVGAGGHFCPVARMLGARHERRLPVVTAQEVEFQATADDLARITFQPETPELYFCADLKGYGWCFRKGDYLNIGLGRVDAEQLSSRVAEFCDFLRRRGKLGCDIPVRFVGHAYQLYERTVPKLVDRRVLLVGDSAGLAYPQSGEGIRPAVESGLMAADAILAADGRYEREQLQPYADRAIERFGRPRDRSVSEWLPPAWLRLVAGGLMATRWFTRNVLIRRWFLHAELPAMR